MSTSRICGAATAPGGIDTTMVSSSPLWNGRVALKSAPSPWSDTVLLHGSVEPVGPSKQEIRGYTPPGMRTMAATCVVGTGQSGPFTFQYSSS